MIYKLLDRLTEQYSENEYRLEAMRARDEFFDRAGRVFDDDAELFEGRMASFLEWYLLERPSAGAGGQVPIVHAVQTSAGRSAEDRRQIAALATTHRSLFQLSSTADRVLEIEDLIGGAQFSVLERRNTAGVAPGDVFEARLMWDGERVVFGRTFLFHPPDAREVVVEWVDRVVKEGMPRAEILFHLSRQYVRWHRLGHIGAAKVYRDV